jgi:hypothetical protein
MRNDKFAARRVCCWKGGIQLMPDKQYAALISDRVENAELNRQQH